VRGLGDHPRDGRALGHFAVSGLDRHGDQLRATWLIPRSDEEYVRREASLPHVQSDQSRTPIGAKPRPATVALEVGFLHPGRVRTRLVSALAGSTAGFDLPRFLF
jgi:hypothetical protein